MSSLAWILPLIKKVNLVWSLPPVGILKMDFDGASKGNLGLAGFGCIIQNNSSYIIRSYCGPLGNCDSIKAKAMALLLGLRELRRLGMVQCIVEGDSQTVISWGSGRGDISWRLAPIFYEIQKLVLSMKYSLKHVDRGQNGLADQLANWGVGYGKFHYDNCLPGDMLPLVM